MMTLRSLIANYSCLVTQGHAHGQLVLEEVHFGLVAAAGEWHVWPAGEVAGLGLLELERELIDERRRFSTEKAPRPSSVQRALWAEDPARVRQCRAR
jgi:hypothetical protein